MFVDLTNQVFERLTVLALDPRNDRNHTYWRCACSCGTVKSVRADSLRNGSIRSCGCLHSEITSARIAKPIKNGTRYGRLTVGEVVRKTRKRGNVYKCVCDCGTRVEVQGRHLRNGESTSCGCYHRDLSATICRKLRTTHGLSGTPEYRAYQSAKRRCRSPNDPAWRHYGGRGITFDFGSFEDFYFVLGPRPQGTSLDRIDNDDGYNEHNVRWATRCQQMNNRRGSRARDIPVIIDLFNNGFSRAAISKQLGADRHTIRKIINSHLSAQPLAA